VKLHKFYSIPTIMCQKHNSQTFRHNTRLTHHIAEFIMRKSIQVMIIKAAEFNFFTSSPKCARNKLTNFQAQMEAYLCHSVYNVHIYVWSLIIKADEFKAGCRPLRVKNLCQLWKTWSFSCQQNDGGRSTTNLQIRKGEVLMREKPTNQPTKPGQ
jgi:hypothetical protein